MRRKSRSTKEFVEMHLISTHFHCTCVYIHHVPDPVPHVKHGGAEDRSRSRQSGHRHYRLILRESRINDDQGCRADHSEMVASDSFPFAGGGSSQPINLQAHQMTIRA
jgi:hypothetical protein